MVTDSAVRERLTDEFPAWCVRRVGRMWVATRRRRLSDAEFGAGLYMTLAEDSVDLLRTELLRQRIAEDRYAEAVMAG